MIFDFLVRLTGYLNALSRLPHLGYMADRDKQDNNVKKS